MSRTTDILDRAFKDIQEVVGEIVTAITLRRGLSTDKVTKWQKKLRNAADTLEDLL